MKGSTVFAILLVLGLLAAANGLFLFANPPWFSPFAGVLLNVSLPFAGAMAVAAYYDVYGPRP